MRNYFCQQKFNYVSIRLYDGYVASCCQATPSRLRWDQLTSGPMGFFNFAEIVDERKQMLENIRVASCESCWQPEDLGLQSRRLKMQTTERTDMNFISTPRVINIILSNTCSQTCVYCCKNFSSSWLNEIVKNGPYESIESDSDYRFTVHPTDLVVHTLSQQTLYKSQFRSEIMEQIRQCADGIDINISGGEPFLDNNLADIVDQVKTARTLLITSGLTVDSNRLKKMCEKLYAIRPDIKFRLSIENVGALHEFNRFGSRYDQWIKNYNIIRSYFYCSFTSVISNLTIFGLKDFLDTYPEVEKNFIYLTVPDFLSVSLLDDESRQRIIHDLQCLDFNYIPELVNFVDQKPDMNLKPSLGNYLTQFAQRRSLGLSIFPESFLHWVFDGRTTG